jgi:hypothetical protein
MAMLNKMDDAGIRGPRVWMLHKDVASENQTKTFQILLNLVNNHISPEDLNHAIDNKTQLQV